MTDEVRRNVVKLGIDFRSIPVDIGDGIEWEFTPDPSPEQWSLLVSTLKKFTKIKEDDIDEKAFKEALKGFTAAMGGLLIDEKQQEKWVKRNYGLGPQQAISEVLMEMWSGFPTKPSQRSGKGSKKTG